MTELRYDDMRVGYIGLLKEILHRGQEVSPRGQRTKELRGVTLVLSDPTQAVPVGTTRALNLRIGAAETVQLVGGVSNLSQLDEVSAGRFSRYADDGRLRGAYGPRVHRQLLSAVESLAEDPTTRQAHVVVWRPEDAGSRSRDVPCTVSFGFHVRDGRLSMQTHMRSNDAFLGVPYDLWMFTRLQMVVAGSLGLPLGDYTHHVDSMHIYERDAERARKVGFRTEPREQPPAPLAVLSNDLDSNPITRFAAHALGARAVALGASFISGGLRWYGQTLSGAGSTVRLCPYCLYADPANNPLLCRD